MRLVAIVGSSKERETSWCPRRKSFLASQREIGQKSVFREWRFAQLFLQLACGLGVLANIFTLVYGVYVAWLRPSIPALRKRQKLSVRTRSLGPHVTGSFAANNPECQRPWQSDEYMNCTLTANCRSTTLALYLSGIGMQIYQFSDIITLGTLSARAEVPQGAR